MNFRIVAPCGIDCFNCELYEKNVTEAFRKRLSEAMKVEPSRITCKGCIDGNQCLLLDLQGQKCKTLECVNNKGLDYCFECDTFPCELIMPLAANAEKMPHNMKLYNLCMMKRIGVEAWCDQASSIRETYFGTNFVIGQGGKK